MIPYIVDTEFFKPASRGNEPSNFMFCPGANDRDPELLLGLAKLGHEIVWLCRDALMRAKYQGQHKNLHIVYDIRFSELRTLYQTCGVVITPLRADIHAAGQTTTLEALACGKPVFLSDGRTATIFKDYQAVEVIDSLDVSCWHEKLIRAGTFRDQSIDSRLAVKTRYALVCKAFRDALDEIN
jgi:hypothetical protein